MANLKTDNIELRSEKVRKFIGEIPPSLVRWGTAILVVIIITLVVVGCFIPYPNSNGESILEHLLDY